MSGSLPPCPESDKNVRTGVLTSDEIQYCVKQFRLVDPFDPEQLRPARYKLTLGEDYAIGGERKKLYESHGLNELTIDPFQATIVSTREVLNMPRFLIARWNLDINLVYQGLLWVGGPQVDPGYYGRLFCPLYNLSNRRVTLRLGQVIAVIDFAKTTPFVKGKTKEYERPPRRRSLEDYDTHLESALFVEAKKKIEDFGKELTEQRRKVERIEDRVSRSIVSIFTVLSILIAAISLIVTNRQIVDIPFWGWITIWISFVALFLSLIPYIRRQLLRFFYP